jgi:hypothetical protein
MSNTLTIPKKIDEAEFWSSIMGSLEFINEWWLAVRYRDDADWDKPGVVELTIEDEDGRPLTKSLTVADLVIAYDKAVSTPHYHCGGEIDIDNMDECASDIVLQIAMFDDVVYG